jgi:hypothetical protein
MEVSGQPHAAAALPSRVRAPDTHLIGGCFDLRAAMNCVGNKNTFPCRQSKPDLSHIQPSVRRYTGRAISVPYKFNYYDLLVTEVKQYSTWFVFEWVTAWEHHMLLAFL